MCCFCRWGPCCLCTRRRRISRCPTVPTSCFPLLAVNHFDTYAGIIFLLGIIAAAYSSADSALTALTTSFCVDFLGIGKDQEATRAEAQDKLDDTTRKRVHVMFSGLLFVVILLFNAINDQSVIVAVFRIAGYTYGPLLGLYSFGLYTKMQVKDRLVPWVCVVATATLLRDR